MSKETFEREWYDFGANHVNEVYELFNLIAKHGGRVVWPLPVPEGEGCTCSELRKDGDYEDDDYDQAGPWHHMKCALYVPF